MENANQYLVSWEKEFNKDLKFIENEVITKQADGRYCKYSTALKAVVVTNMERNAYIDYWSKLYSDKPKYMLDQIIEQCNKKLDEGLISNDEMIDLITNSKDVKSEKVNAIKAINGC